MTSDALRIAWSDDLLAYNFGSDHPMAPARLELTMRRAQALGLLTGPDVRLVDPPIASDELLQTVHDADYVAAVHAAAQGEPCPVRGLGTEDVPIFPKMDEAAARIVGGTVEVAEAVWAGAALRGANIAGGMHHAMPGAAAGFCIFNDAAIAIQRLLDLGARRVAYVDLDAHHGDGVEAAFWDDPRVLTISLHQSGATLFPYTGTVTDVGGPGALGSALNVPLPPGTDSAGWLRAFDAVVPDALVEFSPEIIVSQHGCDGHPADSLSQLHVGIAAQRQTMLWLDELTREHCGGKWVVLGGGGYEIRRVVPVLWTHLLGIAQGYPVPLDSEDIILPDDGGVTWQRWTTGYDPQSPVDQAIRAARRQGLSALGVDTSWDV